MLLPPSGAILQLSAWNYDGANNSGKANGVAVSTWVKIQGTASDFAASAESVEPHLKTASGESPAILFDGVADYITGANTQTTLSFLHETGVFDMFVVVRRLAGSTGYPFGNTAQSTEKGFFTIFDASGNLRVLLCRGESSVFIVDKTTTLAAAVGVPTKFHIRGTGTQVRISKDFSTYQTGNYTAAVIAGAATNTFQLGGIIPSLLVNADFYEFFVYDRNLTADEVTQMGAYILQREGI
jgi:hypothetical protein